MRLLPNNKDGNVVDLVESYSTFAQENLAQDLSDEELDGVLDYEDRLLSELAHVDKDIVEADQVKLTHLWQRTFDAVHKEEGRLLYSRKLPVLSFQINSAPLNKKKCTDVHRWQACRLMRNESQDSLKIIMQDGFNLFECQLTKQSYEELCQA